MVRLLYPSLPTIDESRNNSIVFDERLEVEFKKVVGVPDIDKGKGNVDVLK